MKEGFLLASAIAFRATRRPVGVMGRTGKPEGPKSLVVFMLCG